MKTGRYNLIHAIAATVVLVAAISKDFWHSFLHGAFDAPPPSATVVLALGCQIALFGMLLVFLWASTLFMRKPADQSGAPSRLAAVRYAAITFIPVCLAAFALEFASTAVLEKIFDIKAAGQDLVKWLQPGTYPLSIRLALMAFALFEAPLVEEPLFRGIVFRGLLKSTPLWCALTVSGFVFALIHVNAATLIPLWFLGIAFAWLYWKTGSILAPMTAHFLFNLLNLVLVLSGVAT